MNKKNIYQIIVSANNEEKNYSTFLKYCAAKTRCCDRINKNNFEAQEMIDLFRYTYMMNSILISGEIMSILNNKTKKKMSSKEFK